MNYDRNINAAPKRTFAERWDDIEIMWQNLLIALVLAVIGGILFGVYLIVGTGLLYLGGAIAIILFLWLMVAMVRDF